MISLIVAMSTNGVIGVDGKLPWRLSSDLQRFKKITMGKPIVMGRLTFESIGKALPGRQNIVLTRQADFSAENCDVVTSPADALRAAGDADEVLIIGGGQVYELFLSKASKIYVTAVDVDTVGDAYFPALDAAAWELVSCEKQSADDKNEHAFAFKTYQRRD